MSIVYICKPQIMIYQLISFLYRFLLCFLWLWRYYCHRTSILITKLHFLSVLILNTDGYMRAFSEGVQIGPSNLNGKGNGIVFSCFVKFITRGKYSYWGKYIYCKHNGHFTVVVETEKMRAQPAIKLSQSCRCWPCSVIPFGRLNPAIDLNRHFR